MGFGAKKKKKKKKKKEKKSEQTERLFRNFAEKPTKKKLEVVVVDNHKLVRP